MDSAIHKSQCTPRRKIIATGVRSRHKTFTRRLILPSTRIPSTFPQGCVLLAYMESPPLGYIGRREHTMKQANKPFVVAMVAISLVVLGSTTVVAVGRAAGHGGSSGRSAVCSSFHGCSPFSGSCNRFGRYACGGLTWGVYPGIAYGYGYPSYASDSSYSPNDYVSPMPAFDPSRTDYDAPPPPRATTNSPTLTPEQASHACALAQVKALASTGTSDQTILRQLRDSQTAYHLTAAEIIGLKNSGVSDKVIDLMINTAIAPGTNQ